jgi:hypothetical protein
MHPNSSLNFSRFPGTSHAEETAEEIQAIDPRILAYLVLMFLVIFKMVRVFTLHLSYTPNRKIIVGLMKEHM